MIRFYLFLSLLVLGFCSTSFGQSNDHIQGEILVQMNDEDEVSVLVNDFKVNGLELKLKEEVSTVFRVYSLSFDFTSMNENQVLRQVKSSPLVQHAQFNHFVKKRSTIPDDPLFDQQWYWQNLGMSGGTLDSDVDADLAWDITTGGTTVDGHEIVVCVIEGANRDHSDLQGNLWVNQFEIPNDDLDNDGNGYIDDYDGWNVNALSDFISPDQHGTAVSGVIGAKGNNGSFLSGMNWDVKIMHVDFSSTVESSVVAAYTYPYLMRQKFNETNGEEGALVVATNASWGIDEADPANFPIWCAIYDSLGSVGILNCVATTNDNVNVDMVGDMPGNCPSEFIINVTATDNEDRRNFSGFGNTHVDIAAPGEGMTLLNQNGGPINDSGTSYAAPIISGLVGLLYSAPCSSIGKRSIVDAENMAKWVRDAILNGVDLVPDLLGEVQTGGRVNAFNSLQILMDRCIRCEKPFGFGVENTLDISSEIIWTSSDSTLQTDLRWRSLVGSDWDTLENVESPYLFGDLEACTSYEFQLNDVCQDTMSGYTDSYVFETDGCCRSPEDIVISNISNTSVMVEWNSVLAAISYDLVVSSSFGSFTIGGLIDANFELTALNPCTEYSIQIVVVCEGGTMDISEPIVFTTLGCGACFDADYCPSEGEDATAEWIAEVSLNDLNNTSTSDDGYGNFTFLSTDLLTWENYEINITPGFEDFEYGEWFMVWIDFNQDGEFDGANEEVFNSNGTASSTVAGNILIPGDALLGPTRMRVAMRFNVEPEACDEFFNFGEVEDYCVNIVEGIEPDCYPPSGLNVPLIGNTFADLSWADEPDALSYEMRIRPLSMPIWTVITTSANEVTAINLEFCELHQFQVRSVCVDEKSLWSPSANFLTGCVVNTSEEKESFGSVQIIPNPFESSFQVIVDDVKIGMASVNLIDVNGRIIYKNEVWLNGSQEVIPIDLSGNSIPLGIYFLELKNSDGSLRKKVIKSD